MRSHGRWWVGVCVASGWAGCASDAAKSDASDAATTADTAGDGHVSDGTVPTGGDAAEVVVGVAPSLVTVTAQGVGAKGTDIRIRILGTDPDGDVLSARVRLLDAAGNGVPVFAVGDAGDSDGSETVVALSSVTGTPPGFEAIATLAGLLGTAPTIAKVEVRALDAHGHASEALTADVVPQPERHLGEPCDAAKELDRCEYGLGCAGTPAACQEGQAPTITKLAYLTDPVGAHILIAGTEPEDDMGSVTLDFLDAAGQPVLVDLDNDTVPDASSFEIDGRGSAAGGLFFLRLDTAPAFQDLVAKVAATPRDEHAHVGATITASQSAVPVKGVGQPCSPEGFDRCAAGAVCVPKATGTGASCQAAAGLRGQECQAALVLDPSGVTSVTGVALGASLWDAPIGCQATDPIGRPEGVVRLHLAAPVASLTLSTVGPGTTFDTALYVLAGCGEQTTVAPLGCADDGPDTAASVLTLTALAAGDYLVVVDSFSADGGAFELSVSVP